MSTAIITGASHGLGRALATGLARAGWNLVIDARNRVDLDDAATSIAELGSGAVEAIEGDVTDPGHAEHMVKTAAALDHFSLLVNNASMLGPSPQPVLADYPLQVLEEVFSVNVLAPLRLIQLSLPHLRLNRGTVVDVTSDAAVEAYQGWGGYGSSKAALEQLSHVLAGEEPEVRVYWFDPGDMNTRMHQDAFPGEDISDRASPEDRVPALLRLIDGRFPSGRYVAEHLLSEMVGT
jgi:NAD(P)-dependent dehydrogenase (short-subunit alcohol dehydrogenase family)